MSAVRSNDMAVANVPTEGIKRAANISTANKKNLEDEVEDDLKLTRESGPNSRTTSAEPSSSLKAPYVRKKRYICGECNKAYDRPSLLQRHIWTHTGDRPFKCDECGETLTRKDHLTRHKLKHLSPEDKPFQCTVCNKGCTTLQHLKRHERIHQKSFKCDQCEETFYKHQTLKHHKNSVHFKNRLACEYCNKVFLRPYRLANHKIKQHNLSPGFQCTHPGCFKNFKTWNAVSAHAKEDHPKFVCQICNKGCIGTAGLEMHMKVHDDEEKKKKKEEEEKIIQPFESETCSSSFDSEESLKRHYDIERQAANKDSQQDITKKLEGSHIARVPGVFPTSSTRSTRLNLVPLPEDLDPYAMAEMISSNIDERTISCKYKNCYRLFKRPYDLERHLRWHSKLNLKLDLSSARL